MSALSSVAWPELKSLIQFPFWWYGDGLASVGRWLVNDLRAQWQRFGVRLWIKSWLQPMYGMSDFVSRFISVMMRTVFIVGQTVWWLIHASVYVAVFLLWLVWLPAAFALIAAALVW
jgi:hypothetical protein